MECCRSPRTRATPTLGYSCSWSLVNSRCEHNADVLLVRPPATPTLGYSWSFVKAFQGVSRTLTFTSYACNTYLGIFIFIEFGQFISRREQNAGVHLVRTQHLPWDIHIHGVWLNAFQGVSRTMAFTSYARNTTLGYSYSWRLVNAFQGVSKTLAFTLYARRTHLPWDIHIHGGW